MDYSRLKNLVFGFSFILVSCSQHQEVQTHLPPRTVLQSALKPTTLAILAEQFLEWQKGYNIQIRDHEQGLLVTEWASENALDRHRIQFRVSDDLNGSVLTAHIIHEIYNGGRWSELPSNGQDEAQLLAELEKYLLTAKNPGVH